MTAETVVPHDRNAELAVLSCCLQSRVARDEAKRHLGANDFWEPTHEVVWNAMAALDRDGWQDDPARLMSALAGREEARLLPTLLTYPVAAESVATHARIVRGYGTKRRLIAEAARVEQAARSESTRAQDVAADAVSAMVRVRDSGNTEDIHAITLGELLAEQDDQPDWLVPGLLERRDRFILTGEEGLGKSYLLRQIAVMAAAGLDPFDRSVRIQPIRCLIVDCENTAAQVKRKVRPVVEYANRYGKPGADMVSLLCSPRVDLTRDRDLARVHYEMDAAQPDLVVIGPLYRLTPRALQTDDEAAPVLAALDTLRDRDCALLIEAHAGHAIGKGGSRDLRPRGSSALLGWPEFGYGMRAVASGYADLVPWRGARDARDWPDMLRQDNERIRWIRREAVNEMHGWASCASAGGGSGD